MGTRDPERIEDHPLVAGPSPLAQLIGRAGRASRVVDLPPRLAAGDEQYGGKVAIVALTDLDLQEANLDAFSWLLGTKKMPEWLVQTDQGQTLLNSEIQVQALHRALRVAGALERRWSSSATDVRMHLEPDEREALFTEYLAFQKERSPLKEITPQALEEVLTAVGKGCLEHAALSYYDAASLRSIIIELADRHLKLTRQHS